MFGFQPSPFVKRTAPCRVFALLCSILTVLFFVPGFAQEEPQAESPPLDWTLDPVYEQNSVDGTVLGLSGDVVLSGIRPFAKLGYGLNSGNIRYEAGVGWQAWSVSVYDWADTSVLGRTGESGVMARYHDGISTASLRMAQLWPLDDEAAAPEAQYIQNDLSHTLTGPFDISLAFDARLTLGMLADGRLFESSQHGVRGRWGDLRFSFAQGASSNEAELPGYEHNQGMRGYEDPLKGHSFWRGRVDRRTRLLTVPLDFESWFGPAAAGLALPELAIGVDASAFGEVLRVQPNPDALDADPDPAALEPESYMGWGVGLVLLLDGVDFELRFDLFFNRVGEVQPLFG